MKNIFYVIAAILIAIWAIRFFVYDSGYAVHYLLFLGVASIILRLKLPVEKRSYRVKH
ncbi:MAG: lmo0937 family membrane protein [Bacteroidia bacterium]|nr:lmo0937 family membrane protein [Bacteroidia bacterium]